MALNIVTLFQSSGIFPASDAYMLLAEEDAPGFRESSSRESSEAKKLIMEGVRYVYTVDEKDVDNRPELFLCCGKMTALYMMR